MKSMRRLRGVHRRGDSAGFTLTELLTVMLVLGILCTAVTTLFITSLKATKTTSARLDQTNQGRVAMESMSRILRTAVLPSSLATCTNNCGSANAFIQGSPFSVSFYADIDNNNNSIGPSQVVFAVDASGNLTQTVQPADPGSGSIGYKWTACTIGAVGCDITKTTLATGVQTGGANLFTYYVYGSTTPLSSISGTQLADVDSVDILLSTKESGGTGAAATQFVDRIALPNVDTAVEASENPGGGS